VALRVIPDFAFKLLEREFFWHGGMSQIKRVSLVNPFSFRQETSVAALLVVLSSGIHHLLGL